MTTVPGPNHRTRSRGPVRFAMPRLANDAPVMIWGAVVSPAAGSGTAGLPMAAVPRGARR